MIGMIAGSLAKGLIGGSAKKSAVAGASQAIVKRTKKDKQVKEKPKAIPFKRSTRSSGGLSLANFTSALKLNEEIKKVEVKVEEGDEGDEKVADSLSLLDKATRSLKKAMLGLVNFRKKEDKKLGEEERTAGREAKEKGFESGALGFVRNIVQPFIDNTMDYLKNILLGGIILALVQNIEKIFNYIEKLWTETLEPIFKWLNKWVFGPIWTGLKWIATGGAALIETIMENPLTQGVIDQIKAGLEEIGKVFRPLEQMIKDITGIDFGSGDGSDDEGTSGQTATRGRQMGPQYEGGGSATFDVIASGEGDYNSVNRGTAGDTPGGAKSVVGKNLTDMTVGEVMAAQSSGQLFAVGKYQIIPTTMKEFVSGAGIDKNAKFNEATQEKFKDYVINVKRPEVGRYLRGESDDVEAAAQGLAREFASVGLARPEAGRGVNQSRYAGTGGNRASISTEEIQSALKRDRAAGSTPRMIQPLPPSQRSRGSTPILPGESRVSSDIMEFRQFRTSMGGDATRRPTANPDYYQIREMGVYGSGNYKISPLADDTSYEIGVHKGAGHHENRAFDIPVPNSSAEGDQVAKFWRDRGYKVIWRSAGHYDHVHVEVPREKSKEFFRVIPELQKQPAPPSDRAKEVSQEPSYSKKKNVIIVAPSPQPTSSFSGGGGHRGGSRSHSKKSALNSLTKQRANSQLYSS